MLEEDEYRPLPHDKHGVVRSRVYPGLWLDTRALLAGNAAAVLATLQRGIEERGAWGVCETRR